MSDDLHFTVTIKRNPLVVIVQNGWPPAPDNVMRLMGEHANRIASALRTLDFSGGSMTAPEDEAASGGSSQPVVEPPINLTDAARRLSVGPNTVLTWVRGGSLRQRRDGMFDAEEVDRCADHIYGPARE